MELGGDHERTHRNPWHKFGPELEPDTILQPRLETKTQRDTNEGNKTKNGKENKDAGEEKINK